MPNYKVVNSDQLDSDITAVADAIRERSGTSGKMAFPNGMADAVRSIPSGGGAELPKLDVLVAGHHGSHEATSLELLMVTQPAAVVISVGADNPYGHPREEILNRLSNFNCEIYRTDLQGTITFRR